MKLQTCSKPVAQQKREKNRTKPQNSWAEKLLTKPEGDCVKSAKSAAACTEDCSTRVLSAGGNMLGAEPLSLRAQKLDGELVNAVFASCRVALVMDSGSLAECLASDLV